MELLLPAQSALLLFLSFPHIVFCYLAFIALVPQFHALSGIVSCRKTFACGFIFSRVHSYMLGYPFLYTLIINYQKD
ncbi:MAG TPA: hypothetical protein PK514_12450 [Spirochaetota bacterium]|nr:hypothetical protein [Spirochaetota bacterium]